MTAAVPRRRAPARILVAILTALLILQVAEGAARLHPPPEEPGLFRRHPTRAWALRPGVTLSWHEPISVNSLGLRGPEPGPADQAVLILGDSRTFGLTLPDQSTLDRLLEPDLSKRLGRRIRVYNGGTPGYSSYQAIDVLREVGPVLKPDVVLLPYLICDTDPSPLSDRGNLGSETVRSIRRVLWNSMLYQHLLYRMSGDRPPLHREGTESGSFQRLVPAEVREVIRSLPSVAERWGGCRFLFVNYPSARTANEMVIHGAHKSAWAQEGARLGPVVDLWKEWDRRGLPRDGLFSPVTKVHPNQAGAALLAQDLAPLLAELLEQDWRASAPQGKGP